MDISMSSVPSTVVELLEKISTATKIQKYLAQQCMNLEDDLKCNVMIADIIKLADYIQKMCNDYNHTPDLVDVSFEHVMNVTPTAAPAADLRTPQRGSETKFDRLVEKLLSPANDSITLRSNELVFGNTAKTMSPVPFNQLLPSPCVSPIRPVLYEGNCLLGSTDSLFENLLDDNPMEDGRSHYLAGDAETLGSLPAKSSRPPEKNLMYRFPDTVTADTSTTSSVAVNIMTPSGSVNAVPDTESATVADAGLRPEAWLRTSPNMSPSGWGNRRSTNSATPPNKMNLRQVRPLCKWDAICLP
jgi:hypothetical protein